jgi:hypothetical protein
MARAETDKAARERLAAVRDALDVPEAADVEQCHREAAERLIRACTIRGVIAAVRDGTAGADSAAGMIRSGLAVPLSYEPRPEQEARS